MFFKYPTIIIEKNIKLGDLVGGKTVIDDKVKNN